MEELLQSHMFKCIDCRIAVDMMHEMASDVFPDILNDLGIDHILFNAYRDEQKLFNIKALSKRSYEDMGSVIRALKLNAGFMIYPHGQRLEIICDEGIPLTKQSALYVVMTLLNMEAKALGTTKRVFLPSWAADIIYFDHLETERGQYSNFKTAQMKKYDLIATGEGNFTFTEFATHRDSMYATLKILEMMVHHRVKLSKLIDALPKFFYRSFQIPSSQAMKGKMMRMLLDDVKGKEFSTLDGVKIWLDKNDWILMIPDQYSDHLNLYIQAENDEKGQVIHQCYTSKIEGWMKLNQPRNLE